jgi:hypothetical protein
MLVERPFLFTCLNEEWTFFCFEASFGLDLFIQATGLIFSTAVVVGNAISDVLYALADPRIKVNFVDHSITDQSSILRFIEDNSCPSPSFSASRMWMPIC